MLVKKMNRCVLLTEINALISIFERSQTSMLQKIQRHKLSFSNSTTLVEYTDDHFDKYIPDGRFITGTFDVDNDWIIVYQAFRKSIADYTVKHQDFLGNTGHYSATRMTWIKPNFLWMMYRADWAQRDRHQTNILAIFLKLSDSGFIHLVKHSNRNKGQVDRVNLQWDPHHLPNGDKIVSKRAIQLGVKGSFNIQSFHANIIKIEDITDFVKQQYVKKMNNEAFLVPLERVLDINDVKGDNHLDEHDMKRIKLGQSFRLTNNSSMRKKGKKARKRANVTFD
eukprot:325199_1